MTKTIAPAIAAADKTAEAAGATAQAALPQRTATNTTEGTDSLLHTNEYLGGTSTIYDSGPVDVYAEGKTYATPYDAYYLYVSTYACKYNLNNCTNWYSNSGFSIGWVTAWWHYVDSHLAWYFTKAYHYAEDYSGFTWSGYTSFSGNY